MNDRTLTIDVPDDELEGITDAGNQDRPRPKGEPKGDGGDEGIEALKTQVSTLTQERDDDRKKREDADRARQTAEAATQRERQERERAQRDAESARTEGADVTRVAIDNAISAAQAAADSAESEYATAFEAGDAKKAAAAQRKIARAEAEIAQLNAGKMALPDKSTRSGGRVEAEDRAVEARTTTARPPQTEQEKVDAYIGQFTSSAQDWLRRHPECVTDKSKNYMAIAAHNEAMAQGHQQDTGAYWTFIDRKMGYSKDRDMDDNNRRPDDSRQQRQQEGNGIMAASRTSAPVRGASNGSTTGRSTSVELTPGQQEKAIDGSVVWNVGQRGPDGKIITNGSAFVGEPIGVKEYARRMLAMKKEGRLETPFA